MRDAVKILCGSAVVYLVMAACSSQRRDPSENGGFARGASSGEGFGGEGTATGGAPGTGGARAFRPYLKKSTSVAVLSAPEISPQQKTRPASVSAQVYPPPVASAVT